MKKFFCAVFSFVIVSLLCFAGCSDGWTEVQSITYRTDSDGYIYTSTFYRDISYEEITKEEYKNILENEKTSEYHIGVRFDDITQGEIPVNRKEFISEYTVGEIYLARDNFWLPIEESESLYKFTVNKQEFQYVKIRFVDDGYIEINYSKIKKLVKPTSYEITYFED